MSRRSLRDSARPDRQTVSRGQCKTRPGYWNCGVLFGCLALLVTAPLSAQQAQADEAWSHGQYETARAAYQRVLAQEPGNVRANLRLGVMFSWENKLDSSLVYLARARVGDPADVEIRLIQARVLAWHQQYDAALLRYDSVLATHPGLRDASLGRAQTLAWAGKLEQSRSLYEQILARDSTDVEAMLGRARVSAWSGDLASAEEAYHQLLTRDSRDLEARVGLGYVYLWQGREAAAERQANYVLAIEPNNKGGQELRRVAREASRPSVDASVNWSNDSDENTSLWQTLGSTATLGQGVWVFGSVNALETSDPVREATRVGGEAGLSYRTAKVQLQGAAGARRLVPEVAPPRTVATYRARASYRPVSRLGVSLGYSRQPFDEIAALIEQGLDIESLDAGLDAKPTTTLTLYAGPGAAWLTDGNSRTSFSAGLNQKIGRKFVVGVFGRTLSYEQQGVGYFSPDRFSLLEGTAGYSHETGKWGASLSGGLGAQQIGEEGAAQSEWHLEGRVGPRWSSGSRIEVFGLVTNSAVSSTTGAFRHRAAGLIARIGL
ncbi:MAG: tetratricopeptide repeat protein [Gemmatimonadales bacterium]